MHRGVPHYPVLRQPGYGFFWSKTFPMIREGATDEASNGAVLWVARKVISEDVSSYPTFDAALTKAVRAFQSSSGLEVDGVVGPDTFKALGFDGTVTTGEEVRRTKGALTQQAWFWPTTILVTALAAAAGIVFWPMRRKK
jgi:murein L,D-transpeptidase YcbB/YkuD